MIKLIIFDLDGTLFRTESVDIEAFNRALVKSGYPPKTDEEILNVTGLILDDECKMLLGTEDRQIIGKFKNDVIRFEEEAIKASGDLYSGVPAFLKLLKKKYFKLCICSNGNKEYVEAICNKFGLYSLFDQIWYERDGLTKNEAVKILKNNFNSENFIMVGDRLVDFEAAKVNNGISIGVTYGFGGEEVHMADYIVNDIDELERTIKWLTV